MKVGIVGCGQLVREVHLPNLRRIRGVEVAAISDPAIAGSPSVEELLASPVDGVIVASPTGEHARHAALVLRAGKALYLEKPLASTLEEALPLAALDHGRASMGFNYRLSPIYRQLFAFDGIYKVRSQFTIASRALPEWKRRRATGGGALLDLGSHHIDLICEAVGRAPVSVQGRLRSLETEDDDAELNMDFGGGVHAECRFSFRAAETDFIEADGRRLDRYAPMTYPLWPPGSWWSYQTERRQAPWKEVSFLKSMEAWVSAMRGEAPFAAPLADGLRAMRVIDAAERV